MHRILIIEDEPSIAENIRYALTTEGFETVWCSSGYDGLEALRQTPFDLLVLDIGLPDMNGLELCKDVQRRFVIPVVFVTARSAEIDRIVGLEIGADDYVVKPFSPRELAARVKAVLRRASPRQDRPAVPAAPAPFAIDDTRMRAHYFGTLLDLTRYEFRLLKILVSHPGRVFTREQLMNLAWDSPESSVDRTVDAHIRSLRQKIRTVNAGPDPIVTHRGTGYALRDDW